MLRKKDILTTGQVAQICNVAPGTVTKWFDSGQLKGYRIPGSRDRRIPVSELMRFMKAHNMPIDRLEAGPLRILIIDADRRFGNTLAEALKSHDRYDVQIASNSFDAGITAQKFNPNIILINLASNNIDAANICKNVHSAEDLNHTKVIALCSDTSQAQIASILNKGFDACISNADDTSKIIHTIDRATAIVY